MKIQQETPKTYLATAFRLTERENWREIVRHRWNVYAQREGLNFVICGCEIEKVDKETARILPDYQCRFCE